jgi:hypothetical protein
VETRHQPPRTFIGLYIGRLLLPSRRIANNRRNFHMAASTWANSEADMQL